VASLGITDLATFIAGTVFIVLLPGPNSLYVTTVASTRGVRAGYQAAGGILVGDAILMVLAASGAASLLYASPVLFATLKLIGAAYLGWLGVGLVRSAMGIWAGRAHAQTGSKMDARHPFRAALVICLLNPKAIMFFISFFIQFVDPAYPQPWLSFLALGLIVQTVSLVYLSALIVGGHKLAHAFRGRQWLAAGGTGAIGVVFIGFALRLATSP
jgi:leucine efflux protein